MPRPSEELWAMHGPGWTLPVRSLDFNGMLRVRPTGTITSKMRQALLARFAEICTTADGYWWIAKERMKRHADIVPQEIPTDDVISWSNYFGRTTLTQQPQDMEGFYEEFVRSGHAATVGEAIVRCGAVFSALFIRLAVERKPADLGFIVLEPLPVRPDWMDVAKCALVRMLCNSKKMGYGNDWKSLRAKILSETTRLLSHPSLFMFDRKKRILLWTVCVRHKKPWWRTIIQHETSTSKNARFKTRFFYYVRTAEFLESRKDAMLGMFNDFIAQTRKPSLRFHFGRWYRDHVPRLAKGRRVFPWPPGTRQAGPPLDLRSGETVPYVHVDAKASQLRALSDLQQQAPDVRDGAAQSADPPAGTEGQPGVRVLDSSEGVTAGE